MGFVKYAHEDFPECICSKPYKPGDMPCGNCMDYSYCDVCDHSMYVEYTERLADGTMICVECKQDPKYKDKQIMPEAD